MAPIEHLPRAVLQLIFDELDLESAFAARVSSLVLHSAFESCKTWLLPRLVRREIGDDLWVDALAAHCASGARYAKREDVVEFLHGCYARDEETFAVKMDIDNVIEMIELWEAVLFFCEKLGTEALRGGSPAANEGPMTATERLRICRALYRFELSCKCTQDVAWYDGAEPFYAPWENEQLSCIYQALMKIVSPAVNLMYADDERSNDDHSHRLNVETNCRAQVSWGLVHVKCFVDARSPESLVPIMLRDHIRGFYFGEYMRRAMCPFSSRDGRIIWDGHNPVTFAPSYPSDGDTGPEAVWAWAHSGLMLFQTANNPFRTRLRSWFYVFWDRARLDDRGTMTRPWHPQS